jgi:hypothetical protein
VITIERGDVIRDHLDRVMATHPVRGQARSQDRDGQEVVIIKLITDSLADHR